MASEINVQGSTVTIIRQDNNDFISLTDMAKHKNPDATGIVIAHWMSTRYTVEFMGVWEKLNNPDFNVTEFSNIKNESGSNGFVLSTKQWVEKTNAIGIYSKTGRYNSGTFAHKDIAFEFASWISVEFKLYLIKEFQRLKDQEQKQLGWDIRRNLAKINYRIHTDAIKENLIPPELTKTQISLIYASEADILNMALFGMTAKYWRDTNPEKTGNIRDYADISQLVCLSNLENLNAHFIENQLSQSERLAKLNKIAIQQMKLLTEHAAIERMESVQTAAVKLIEENAVKRIEVKGKKKRLP
ncbi:MAG TPA: KilA-N domain-containing protein [Chitinispirillaceae bacterium]|nr:KilA-N domain-containing protein [Chitinispirillaceae bacterium]